MNTVKAFVAFGLAAVLAAAALPTDTPLIDAARNGDVEAVRSLLAEGADVIVHSTMHPVFAPGQGSKFPPPVYYRQSNAADLGAMAQRAGVRHLVMTHLIPSLDSPSHGPFVIPGGALDANDFESAAVGAGFQGKIHVGRDLLTLRLP